MAGYREFQTGEVLTAANVNDFLMQQSVMKFADAAARDTALGTAVGGGNALREGMVAYLDSTDEVLFYDGSSWEAVVLPLGTSTPTDGQILAYGTATATWNPTDLGIWQSYTPTLTNLTLGNGTLTGRYAQIGKVVFYTITFVFGSTSSISGVPAFSYPVTAAAASTRGVAGATAFIVDVGTTFTTPAFATQEDIGIRVRIMGTSGTYVAAISPSATVPWTWATGDAIWIAGTYEAS